MPLLPCDVCGKERQFNPAVLLRTKHHFCSWACWVTWRKGKLTGAESPIYNSEEKPCVICGTMVIRQKGKRRSRPRSVCSKECWRALMKQRMTGENHPLWKGGAKVTEPCTVCGKPVHRTEREANAHRPMCSKQCLDEFMRTFVVGPNHPNWKGGREPYYGPDWATVKRQVRERDALRCRHCGRMRLAGERQFDVHHLIPRRDGGTNALDNLILVCPACHIVLEWEYQRAQGWKRKPRQRQAS